MTDDMTKIRDQKAKNHGIEKYPVHPLANNGFTQDINFARRMSHTQSFQDGWDARDAIANEQLKAKDAQVDELKISYSNLQKQLSVDFQYQEIKKLKQALDVAVNSINQLHNEWQKTKGWKNTWAYKLTNQALTSINEIINQTKQSSLKD